MSSSSKWGTLDDAARLALESLRRRSEELHRFSAYLEREEQDLKRRKDACDEEQSKLENERRLLEEMLDHKRNAVKFFVENNERTRVSIVVTAMQKSNLEEELKKAKHQLEKQKVEEDRFRSEIVRKSNDLSVRYANSPWVKNLQKIKEERRALEEQIRAQAEQKTALEVEVKRKEKAVNEYLKYPFKMFCIAAASAAIKSRNYRATLARTLVEISHIEKLLSPMDFSQPSSSDEPSHPLIFVPRRGIASNQQERAVSDSRVVGSVPSGATQEVSQVPQAPHSVTKEPNNNALSQFRESLPQQVATADKGAKATVVSTNVNTDNPTLTLPEESEEVPETDVDMRVVVIDEISSDMNLSADVEAVGEDRGTADDAMDESVQSEENVAEVDEVTANEVDNENIVGGHDDLFTTDWDRNAQSPLQSPDGSTSQAVEPQMRDETQEGTTANDAFNFGGDDDRVDRFFQNASRDFDMNNFNLSSINANSSQDFDPTALLNMSNVIPEDGDGGTDFLSMFGGNDGNGEGTDGAEGFQFHFGNDTSAEDASQGDNNHGMTFKFF